MTAHADSIEDLAEMLSEWSLPNLNKFTIELAKRGIAASFSQYIPEFHDAEAPEPDELPASVHSERPIDKIDERPFDYVKPK